MDRDFTLTALENERLFLSFDRTSAFANNDMKKVRELSQEIDKLTQQIEEYKKRATSK